MSDFTNPSQKLIDIIKNIKDKGPKPYDVRAVVKRVDRREGKAYVRLADETDETPVDLTIDCSPGETVQVRVGGGRAWLTGNQTDPPASGKRVNRAQKTATGAAEDAAKAQETADEALANTQGTQQHFWFKKGSESESGAHVTEVTRENFESNPYGGNLLLRSNTVRLRNALKTLAEFVDNGTNYYDADSGNIVASMRYQKDYLNRNVFSLACGPNNDVFASQELRATDEQSQYVISTYWKDGNDSGDTTMGISKNAFAVNIYANYLYKALFQLTDTKFAIGYNRNVILEVDAQTGNMQILGNNLLKVIGATNDNYTLNGGANATVSLTLDSTVASGYTPIGIVRFNVSNATNSGTNASDVWVRGAYLSGSTPTVKVVNSGSSTAKIKITAGVLYTTLSI